jgi:hypothetical protein
MTFLTPDETPLAGLEREAAVARDQTIADLFLHPVLGEITRRYWMRFPPTQRHDRGGGDADLVIFDPDLTRTINGSMLKSNADYSVYQGWRVTGWPVLALRRGEIVHRDDEVIGRPGSGVILRRGLTSPL